jgi:CubicO group peptidase (beta-lactamase class C family)
VKAVTVLLGLCFSAAVLAAPDEEALGKWQGYPVCDVLAGDALSPRCLVGLFSNYDKVFTAHRVLRGPKVLPLKPAPLEVPITYKHRDNPPADIKDFLSRNRNTGLLIIREDTVLYEHYQYDRKPEHRLTSMSMAKTVIAMLVGIALAEKKIHSIDDPAKKYLPKLEGHPYGETLLRDLLTMSSGMQFREEYDGKDDVALLLRKTVGKQGPGGVDTVLHIRKRDIPPATRFRYSSADTQVLALALRAAIGMPLSDYLSQKIWQPIGAEADATWVIDGGGFETGYMGINATLRDWGRLGMLLANEGVLNGRQILPPGWVKAMTIPEARHLVVGVATRNNGYGYQTWVIDPGKRYFAMLGVRGQAVFVDPETKTVVVHTAVHASPRDLDARSEQFSLFYGVLNALKPQPQS